MQHFSLSFHFSNFLSLRYSLVKVIAKSSLILIGITTSLLCFSVSAKVISIDDGVIPSPNSIIAEQLYNIGHVIFDDYYLDLSDKMVSSVKDIIDGNINSYSVWANNILNRVESFYEIAVIGPNAKDVTDNISIFSS